MNTLPQAFEERMKALLKEEWDAFFRALQSEPPVSIRLNPARLGTPGTAVLAPVCGQPVEWCPSGYYLKERPVFTLDPCFHGGAYYVQEASSMFLSHVISQIMPAGDVRALDLCAAPGGKSTLLASQLSPGSLLLANEVIRSRASILKENIIKWGRNNIVVTNNDPADFQDLESTFDLILVDAPCSGEGMFRKDPKAIGEWSEDNLRLCSERQKRILTDVWNALKPGGFLIYSTCTYNPAENEGILEWLTKNFEAESIRIEHSFSTITPTDSKAFGYHFYPHKTTGEGFFIGVVRKTGGRESTYRKSKKANKTKPVILPAEIARLIGQPDNVTAFCNENAIGFLPAQHEEFISRLEEKLRIIYKGCEAAEPNYKKIKLLHPLALYAGLNLEHCHTFAADTATALTFLKKEEIRITAEAGEWVLITHQGIGLGWGKSLGNRLNNYYPKEWRIRMDINQ